MDEFDAPAFENTAAVRWMHGSTPRFGHSRELLALMVGSEDEQKDYQKGLLASSITLICMFVVWSIVLITLKLMGPGQVGWWSGKTSKRNPAPRQTPLLKGLVCFAGFSIILCSLLMSINGYAML